MVEDADYDIEYKTKMRAPVFSGLKKDYLDWKVIMEAYLMDSGMIDLLLYDKNVPNDDTKWTEADLKDEQKVLEKKVWKQNKKAFLILLMSMDKKTKHGMVAFQIVRKNMDKKKKYAGGNFQWAWKQLEEKILSEGRLE